MLFKICFLFKRGFISVVKIFRWNSGYRLFPGNRIDQTTLRPALSKDISALGFGKVIIVADGGLNSDKNIADILKSGDGYILSKSTKKSDKNVKNGYLTIPDMNGMKNALSR